MNKKKLLRYLQKELKESKQLEKENAELACYDGAIYWKTVNSAVSEIISLTKSGYFE